MIAKNFVKYPEALRFQREMFSNGYHNSPRIMRLMECVFDWSATVPDWWKEAKGRARSLARLVKKSINDFFKDMAVKASDQLSLVLEAPRTTNHTTERLAEMYRHVNKKRAYSTPDLEPYLGNGDKQWHLRCSGAFRRLCPTQSHVAAIVGGFQYANEA